MADAKSNVEPLHGDFVIGERKANPYCVKALEDLLEMARSGEVVGFNGAAMLYDATAMKFRGGGMCYSSIGALQCVIADMAKDHNSQ